MSIRHQPTLLELAGKQLLRDQASAIAALEHLPAELFPPPFLLAYHSRRHHECLKAMAQAWTYPVLPLAGLMHQPRVKVLKAVLDGLDLLLAQKVHPRRWKLRVLDLRNLGTDFWRRWCGYSTRIDSPTRPMTVHRSSPNMEHPLAPLEVFLDLHFDGTDRDAFFMYVIHWAQQRAGLLHLCCKTLRIAEVPFPRLRKVLDAVQLDCIQEVEVDCTWDLPTLGTFALYLGQMRNLQRLSLSHIQVFGEEEDEDEDEMEEEQQEEELEEEDQEMGEEEESEREEQEEEQEMREEEESEREEQEEEVQDSEEEENFEWEDQEEEEEEKEEEEEEKEEELMEQEEQVEQMEQGYFSEFLSQLLRLEHLRELDMDSPSFLRGRLDQMLRCLHNPLDKLSITICPQLTHSDLTHLFQCPNLRQLKCLHLYRVNLADFSPEPLRALLEAVAPTLQDLGLDNCALVDSQVQAILPVLSRCLQLRFFTTSENDFSVATVEKLLRHTTGLRCLELEVYPVPMEGYRAQGTVNQDKLALIRAELTGILKELGQPRTILLDTKRNGHRDIYEVAFS